jgi:hypothetical protein
MVFHSGNLYLEMIKNRGLRSCFNVSRPISTCQVKQPGSEHALAEGGGHEDDFKRLDDL